MQRLAEVFLLLLLGAATTVHGDCSALNTPYIGMQFASSDACFTYLTQQVVGSPGTGATSQTCLQDYTVCVSYASIAVTSFASVPDEQLFLSVSNFKNAIVQLQSNAVCVAVVAAYGFYSSNIQTATCGPEGSLTLTGASTGTTVFMVRLSTIGAVVGTLAVTA